MNIRENMLDSLFKMDEIEEEGIDEIFSDKTYIPKKCLNCRTALICSVLPTFLNLSKIKIIVSIEDCPFCILRKTQQSQSNGSHKSTKT